MKDAGMQDQAFVNLLTNGGFKAFFGDENNKAEVMEVINSLLPEHCSRDLLLRLQIRRPCPVRLPV